MTMTTGSAEPDSNSNRRSADGPLDEIDVFNPENYVAGVPHQMFDWLRAESPVFWHHEPRAARGFWAVTKHRDIVEISRDPRTYSSYRGGTFIKDEDPNGEDLTVLRLFLLNMDPPQHSRFRNIVRHGFIPKIIAHLEPRIRQRVKDILDGLSATEVIDLVPVAAQLPLEVIAEMIGVPHEDRAMMFDLSNRCVDSLEPDADEAKKEDGKACAMQMLGYAGELAQKRFEAPGDDLISVLIHGAVDGALEAMEFAVFYMLLIVAGFETTRNLISTGTLALLQHPDQRDRLVADPSLIPSAIEEMLRWDPPIVYFRRTATRDVELRGQKIRENDKVVLYYVSANRDEEVFADPHRFDVGRSPNDHLAFGTGEHICLGMTLARLEIRLMFEEMLRRHPRMVLAGTPERYRSSFVNGLRHLPVRLGG